LPEKSRAAHQQATGEREENQSGKEAKSRPAHQQASGEHGSKETRSEIDAQKLEQKKTPDISW